MALPGMAAYGMLPHGNVPQLCIFPLNPPLKGGHFTVEASTSSICI